MMENKNKCPLCNGPLGNGVFSNGTQKNYDGKYHEICVNFVLGEFLSSGKSIGIIEKKG